MRLFDRLSIRGKLLMVILAVSLPTILMLGVSILYFESQRTREALRQELSTLATLLGERSIGSIAFRDAGSGGETLGILATLPHVEMGCLYHDEGRGFATYLTQPGITCPPELDIRKARDELDGTGLGLQRPIVVRGEVIGAILLRSSLKPVGTRIREQLVDRGLITLMAITLAVLLALYLQRLISGPIERIREVAARIEAGGDPALRAPVAGEDEVAHLARGFNRMLDTIQEQNRSLAELNARLDERVRARTAELETTNRELESFTYTVSHDLRSPLRAILGFAEILRGDHAAALDPAAEGLLKRIHGNAARMASLIDDLLGFARVGRAELALREVNMRNLVDGVVAELPAGPGAAAEVVIGELPNAHGDPAMLRQVWQNLIGNAHKFSARVARPRIEIGGAAAGGMLEYYVRDNGAGFEMQYADKLFAPFQRLHSDQEFEGSGVGLAIVSRIVQRHGGSVEAQGESGRGATTRFRLPRR